MKKHKDYRGFTIIEVVLVLAIAGLIFLMIFIALPVLQRSQRDTQRKNDAGNLLAAIIQFQSNNKGQRPYNDGNNAWTKLKPYWNKSNLLNDRPPGDKGGYYLKYGGSVPKKAMAVTVELEGIQTDAYGGGWGYCIDTESN